MEENGVHQQVEVQVQVQGSDSTFVAKEETLNAEQDALPEDQEMESPTAVMKDEEEDDFRPDNTNITSQFDTTDAFNEVFGEKRAFDSWDEFTDYLEAFQNKSGIRFKPRSACRVDHVNERRSGNPIPDRFCYAAVKMICVHFGNAGTGKRNYVGKGCQAYLRVSHSRGAMRVTQTQLIHYNHDPIYEENHKLARNFRVFNFTEELDQIIAQEVLGTNPFQYKNGEKEWAKVIDRLKDGYEEFTAITPRLIKKRVRFLLDNFAAITQGRKPPAEDEMGTILYNLDIAKKEGVKEIASTKATPVSTRKKGRGRPSKVSLSDYEDDPTHDGDADYADDSPPPSTTMETRKKRGRGRGRLPKASLSDCEDSLEEDYTPAKKTAKRQGAKKGTPAPKSVSNMDGDLSQLVVYLQHKDEENKKIRQKELEADRSLRQNEMEEERKMRLKEMEEDRKLRQKDMDLRKEELAFQRERFEFEKTERKEHMDLLKSQLQVFEQSMLKQQPQQQQIMPMTIVQPPQPSLPPQAQPSLPSQQQPQQAREVQPQGTDYNQFHYR